MTIPTNPSDFVKVREGSSGRSHLVIYDLDGTEHPLGRTDRTSLIEGQAETLRACFATWLP